MQPTLSRHSNTVKDSFPRRRNSDLGFHSVFQLALDLWQAVLYRDFYDPTPNLKEQVERCLIFFLMKNLEKAPTHA